MTEVWAHTRQLTKEYQLHIDRGQGTHRPADQWIPTTYGERSRYTQVSWPDNTNYSQRSEHTQLSWPKKVNYTQSEVWTHTGQLVREHQVLTEVWTHTAQLTKGHQLLANIVPDARHTQARWPNNISYSLTEVIQRTHTGPLTSWPENINYWLTEAWAHTGQLTREHQLLTDRGLGTHKPSDQRTSMHLECHCRFGLKFIC